MHSVSLSFRLRLSFECEQPNSDLAVHKSFQLPFSYSQSKYEYFYFEMSGQIAIWQFSIKKGMKISECQFGHTQVIQLFTLKHKWNLSYSKYTLDSVNLT